MKTRACTIDFRTVSLHELNKALAFYYGRCAYITDEEGGMLYYDLDIDDEVINHLVAMTKSSRPERVIDKLLPPSTLTCCPMHSLASTDIELENSTIICDQYSIECMRLIKLIYTQMANFFFSTCHLSVPSLIDIKHLHTAGYFEKFPTQAMIASTLPLEPALVNDFIERLNDNPQHALMLFSDKKYALNPVTCYQVYSNFSKLYDKYQCYRFTIEGKAHRYEGKNSENGRLIEFNMAEIVFMENELNTVQVNDLIQFYKNFFLKLHLPIEFKTSSDAFFTVDAKFHSQLQERTSSKIELICNHFAIGSINTHYDYFSKRFNLASRCGVISTKCTGIGIERVLLALNSYHCDNVKELLTDVYSSLNTEYSCN